MRTFATLIAGAWLAALAACTTAPVTPDMNAIAERYVKLVLLVGQHDSNFVDAYYGDPSWKPSGAPLPLPELASLASALRKEVAAFVLAADADETTKLRHRYLDKQLAAVDTRIAMLGGRKLTYDEEA